MQDISSQGKKEFAVGFFAGLTIFGGIALILLALFFL